MSKLADLIREIEQTVTPDDVIKVLFSSVKSGRITKDPEKIHKAIYVLKQRYPRLFEQFDFDESGLTPFSDLLDRVLFRMETSTLLGTINPKFSHYELSDSIKQDLKNSLEKFSDEDKQHLITISEQFEQLVEIGV
ncbi:MAG: hypothetical protein AB1556_14455 [Bacillota bacterium]